ncbi:protein of unknown function [Petrocella atlantisensis]|uniref:Uncharacterized protein n=1 Tax=Petrocella atlantisensis TaxID=2173034 RepID=A0A3P7PI95_9FIRM|nr:protein of unknown function [Petrocella atlantisensis]
MITVQLFFGSDYQVEILALKNEANQTDSYYKADNGYNKS